MRLLWRLHLLAYVVYPLTLWIAHYVILFNSTTSVASLTGYSLVE